jgi:hypothetical protein
MPLVNPTLPNDGESADAVDISGPFLELLAVFNGHIGADNLEPGTIDAAISDGAIVTDKLAASAVTAAKIADGAITPAKIAAAVSVTDHTASTITPVGSTRMYIVTALSGNTTIAAPTGTPVEGQALTLRIKDSGTIRTISWNAIYRAIGLTLPTATVAGKEMYISLIYNSVATKWDVVSLARQA